MDLPDSFEVTEYGEQDATHEKVSVIAQIVSERVRENPAHGVQVSFGGNEMILKYHCYEMHLSSRMRQVEATANDVFREIVSLIKKEFRKRTKKSIDLKELKEKSSHSVQKVSMNERFYVIFCRSYEMK